LREFSRKRLPAAIIERPKRGFPVPAYQWLEGATGAWAEDRLLHGGRMKSWFDISPVAKAVKAARQGSRAAQHKVWSLLVLDHWLEAFT
jgi:asparagine synthase (glutamine-hydrolysing)